MLKWMKKLNNNNEGEKNQLNLSAPLIFITISTTKDRCPSIAINIFIALPQSIIK